MYTYKVAGPMVLIELELIRHMGRLMGFPEAEGVFTPGGSLSNLTAIVGSGSAATAPVGGFVVITIGRVAAVSTST